jgi:hypothetical protein
MYYSSCLFVSWSERMFFVGFTSIGMEKQMDDFGESTAYITIRCTGSPKGIGVSRVKSRISSSFLLSEEKRDVICLGI